MQRPHTYQIEAWYIIYVSKVLVISGSLNITLPYRGKSNTGTDAYSLSILSLGTNFWEIRIKFFFTKDAFNVKCQDYVYAK